MTRSTNPLIVAADFSDPNRAETLAKRLVGIAGMVKIGLELFTAAGPEIVRRIGRHLPVFLDLKLHDIPTTVERASTNAARLGVEMVTVHGLGGAEMIRAAASGAGEGAAAAGVRPPAVVAVTILSSLAEQEGTSSTTIGFEAVRAGASGLVVSGEQVAVVRETLGGEPILVVPGIRPAGASSNDHARLLTPREAIEAGADYLVVGRPITQADDPAAAASRILEEATA
ncbi:MAG: orotidine-5'-phosphate decarboxylase [Actinomycetota bacterium]